MQLIKTEDLLRSGKMNKLGGESIARLLILLLRFNRINKVYSKTWDKDGIKFIDALIDELEIKYEVSDEELQRIPAGGPFITVSNHPYGGIDGLLLLHALSKRRADFRIMANFLLSRIEPIKEHIISGNPFEKLRDAGSGISGLKEALTHLRSGSPLGIFPAGEVSVYNDEWTGVTDRQWQSSAIKFIKRAQVPVVPVYFQGTNSRIFHLLGMIHPVLRTIKLPSELLNKRNKIIKLRIGNPVPVKDQHEFTDTYRYGRYLRARTYSLGTSIEVKKFFSYTIRRSSTEEPVIDAVPATKMLDEITSLSDFLLFKSGNFSVYCAPSVIIPNITNEIGRLREITFRDVGEGTNRKIDIDEFDLYYHQLFIWDDDENRVAGAYRAGKGKEVIDKYGLPGLYISTLFKIDKRLIPVLEQSIELGRSFIAKDYQKKPLPLFLLWKGILYFLIKNPDYRYLIGPVSISNRYSKFSKAVIIKFITDNYFNNEFARLIKPKNKFKVDLGDVDTDIILGDSADLGRLDRFIQDIDPSHYTVPVLLKKYLKQSGKIIGFNIDPKFNNSLDGLLVLDLYDVPLETITALSKEIKDESLLQRFYGTDTKL
ncbi:MAG: GNAT family N-acetyltransferase [Marinilabiliales bacterium]|nr:MAG: GNAT family N-acetyltransferase [Marinilabiliales bacterium]